MTIPEHPFAVWTVFRGAPRWWFARGCPPSVRDDRFWVRLVRLTALVTAMGVVTALAGEVVCDISATFDVELKLLSNVQALALGVVFAVGILLPVSRWIGRGWTATCLSVPISAAAMLMAIRTAWEVEDLWQDGVWDSRWTGLIWMVCFGAINAAWLNGWRRPMLTPFLAVVVVAWIAVEANEFIALAVIRLYRTPFTPVLIHDLWQFHTHLTETVLLGLAVSSRLVWCPDCGNRESSREE